MRSIAAVTGLLLLTAIGAAPALGAVPVANDDDETVQQGHTATLDVLANDTGLTDAPIRITVTSAPSHGQYYIFDASSASAALVRYAADAGYLGTDSFTYTLTDADGDTSNPATVHITANSTPVAVFDPDPADPNAQPIVAQHGVERTINVLANDTGLLDTPLTLTIATAPAHGTAVVVPATDSSNPYVRYTSAPDFLGPTDTFTYQITDADGQMSAPAAVTVTVNNDVPVANDDPGPPPAGAIIADARAPKTINVLANDTQLSDRPITLEITQAPTHGTATVGTLSSGLPAINYTPNKGADGDDTLRYKLRDADGDTSADATVTVTTHNVTPGAVDDTVHTVENNTSTTINVLTNIGDPSKNDTGKANSPLTLTITQQPSHGSASVIAGSATSEPVVRYTPATGFLGDDSFRYTFRDADGDTSPTDALVPITVVDSVPIPLAAGHTAVGDARVSTAVDVLLTDQGLADLPVSLQITQQPVHGTAAIVSIARADGTVFPGIGYTSNLHSAGDDVIRYTITDADGDVSATEGTLTFSVVDDTPVANSDQGGDSQLLPDNLEFVVTDLKTPIDIVRNDTHRGNRPLTINISTVHPPQHGTVEVNTAEETKLGRPGITYTSSPGYVGQESFGYTLTDADGDTSNEATVSFQVLSFPKTTTDGPESTNQNVAIDLDVLHNDGGLAYTPIHLAVVDALNGTAVVNADNTITFTPDRDFSGRYPFGAQVTYSVTDAYGQSAQGQAYIDVYPPPVVSSKGGSSSMDPSLLALLGVGGALRRRIRNARPR